MVLVEVVLQVQALVLSQEHQVTVISQVVEVELDIMVGVQVMQNIQDQKLHQMQVQVVVVQVITEELQHMMVLMEPQVQVVEVVVQQVMDPMVVTVVLVS